MRAPARLISAVLLLAAWLATAAWGEITVSIAETRARSAILGVDEATAAGVKAQGAWQPLGPPAGRQRVRVLDGDASDGSRSASLASYDAGPAAWAGIAQDLRRPLEGGKAYDFILQAHGTVGADGEATAVVEGRAAAADPWQALITVVLDVRSAWLEYGGQFRVDQAPVEVRVAITVRGKGSLLADSVRLAQVGSDDNLVVDASFEGVSYWRAMFRTDGAEEWATDGAAIHEPTHALLALRPATAYEVYAELISTSGEVLERSLPLRVSTLPEWSRRVGDWTAEEPQQLRGAGLTAPCLVSAGGRAMLVAAHGGGIYIHPIERDGSLGDPTVLVSAVRVASGWAEVERMRACVHRDVLYIAYRIILGPAAADRHLRVAALHLRSGAVTGPVSAAPKDPTKLIDDGAVAGALGKLWVAFAETDPSAAPATTRLALRPLDLTTLEPAGDDVPLPDVPSPYLECPSVAAVGDRLVVLYSDRGHVAGAGGARAAGVEPLYAQSYDGTTFSSPVVVSSEGLNRDAFAVELGDRLAVVWQFSGPYAGTAVGPEAFSDVGLAWLGADMAVAGPYSCVGDQTLDASPSVAAVGERLLVVCRKWEHAHDLPDDPAADLGLWATWLETATPDG